MYYIISIALVFVLVGLNRIISAIYQSDTEKLSPFECGILEIGDARQRFDISFYVIALLFLIFDLEVILVFPYASVFFTLG
jgi:NADH-quinone oxidoreductase subunit A